MSILVRKFISILSDGFAGSVKYKKKKEYSIIITEVDIDSLFIDTHYFKNPDGYQRHLDENRALSIAENYSIPAEKLPLVSERVDTKMIFIIDGQHTIASQIALGATKIRVRKITKPTTQKEEASLFHECNAYTAAVSSKLKLQNMYKLNDIQLVIITKIIEKHGFNISWTSHKYTKNTFNCTQRIIRIYEIDQGSHLDVVLNFMNKAFGSKNIKSNNNYRYITKEKFLLSVSNFLLNNEETFRNKKSMNRLIEQCKITPIENLYAGADDLGKSFRDVYNNNLRKESRI